MAAANEDYYFHPRFSCAEPIYEAILGWIGKAFDKTKNVDVVIKARTTLDMDFRGAMTALREVTFMSAMKHPNVMTLQNVIGEKPRDKKHIVTAIYMQMELMHGSLRQLVVVDRPEEISVETIQNWMFQILKGLHYIHSAGVVHRDMKPDNVLVSQSLDVLKIADFDSARYFGQKVPNDLTERVTTDIYRAPEVQVRPRRYSYEIDMWSVGCLFYFLFTKAEVIQREAFMDVTSLIISAIGTPSGEELSDVADKEILERIKQLPFKEKVNWKTKLPERAPDTAIELLGKMLQFSARNRITVVDALYHKFLANQRPQKWTPDVYKGRLKRYRDSKQWSIVVRRLRKSITLEVPRKQGSHDGENSPDCGCFLCNF